MREVPFAELDELIKHFDQGYLVSHDEAYKRFAEARGKKKQKTAQYGPVQKNL
jgi:hypothetical protein